VFPEKYELNGSSVAIPICWLAPRSNNPMKGSPAISSENLVQRAHSTQRSLSSKISVLNSIGLGKVLFSISNLDSARPAVIA
jgi:hypothetical protein